MNSMDFETELRLECLRLAIRPSRSGHEDVENAEAYLNFILQRTDQGDDLPSSGKSISELMDETTRIVAEIVKEKACATA